MELEIQSSLFKLKEGQIWLGDQRVVLLFLSLAKVCLKWESQTIQSSVFKLPSDSSDNNHTGTSGHGRHPPPSKSSHLPRPPSLAWRGTKGLSGQLHTHRFISFKPGTLSAAQLHTHHTREKGHAGTQTGRLSAWPSWVGKIRWRRGGLPTPVFWPGPRVGKIPWNRQWQPTPVFLPGKFHGQRSLEGYSSWGCKESDMTEQLST